MENRIAKRYSLNNSILPVSTNVATCYDLRMAKKGRERPIHKRRRENLLILKGRLGSFAEIARRTGTNPSHLSQINQRKRDMGNEVAEQIESGLGLPELWMSDPPNTHRDQGGKGEDAKSSEDSPWRSFSEVTRLIALGAGNHLTEEQQREILKDIEARKRANEEVVKWAEMRVKKAG